MVRGKEVVNSSAVWFKEVRVVFLGLFSLS
jgi:hypothetical protein